QAVMQLLARPEVINAILSLAMGVMGRNQIQVGNYAVPAQQLASVAMGTQYSGGYDDEYTEHLGITDEEVIQELYAATEADHPFGQAIIGHFDDADYSHSDEHFAEESGDGFDMFGTTHDAIAEGAEAYGDQAEDLWHSDDGRDDWVDDDEWDRDLEWDEADPDEQEGEHSDWESAQ
ncbi:MAG: hypothetical protein AAFR64_13680, partial [Pseudomonadota bacterium]